MKNLKVSAIHLVLPFLISGALLQNAHATLSCKTTWEEGDKESVCMINIQNKTGKLKIDLPLEVADEKSCAQFCKGPNAEEKMQEFLLSMNIQLLKAAEELVTERAKLQQEIDELKMTQEIAEQCAGHEYVRAKTLEAKIKKASQLEAAKKLFQSLGLSLEDKEGSDNEKEPPMSPEVKNSMYN